MAIQSPAYTHGGGTAQGAGHVEGARAREAFDTDEQKARKAWEPGYHTSRGAGGLGGAARRNVKGYKEDTETAWKTHWAKQMSPPPAKAEAPKLTDIKK